MARIRMMTLAGAMVVTVYGCGGPGDSGRATDGGADGGAPADAGRATDGGADGGAPADAGSAAFDSLKLVKKVTLTGTGEGFSARPEIAATADKVFVIYLGNLGSSASITFSAKVFDADLSNAPTALTLVQASTTYGSPTDIRIAADGEALYAFYETSQRSQTSNATYLWAAKFKLDDAMTQMAATPTPLASSSKLAEVPDGHEMLDDPAPLVGPDSVFVVTRLDNSLSSTGDAVYRVRELSKDSLTLIREFDLNLSTAATPRPVSGRGRVCSLRFVDGKILMVLPTTSSDDGIREASDDGAQSDLVLVTLDSDWTFVEARKLSAEPNDWEGYVTGLHANATRLFVTYTQGVGGPGSGERRAQIKIFDRSLALVHLETVRNVTWGPGGGEVRPSLELRGNRLYSGQSVSTAFVGDGDAEVSVYESN
ncbi:MAG: hypothetical protein HY906_16315 [Deltaproteobacteria bacterium]|nr:hypothetical protein [Deltaproteobacteria bacterium]